MQSNLNPPFVSAHFLGPISEMDNTNKRTNLMNAARIWSFDGGGPAVLSQLLIVKEIMHRIQWNLKLDDVPRPCDYAEIMVGSGLGVVAVVLLARLRLTAEQTLVHLVGLGQSVFLEPTQSNSGPQFNHEILKMATKSILQQHGLADTTKMIEDALTTGHTYAAVTSTPTSNLSNCRTYRTPSPEYNCTIVEAIQAAMAVPDWFPPVEVGPTHLKESLAGGSIGFNNPTKKALDEATRVFGTERQTSIILSFGSGRRHIRSLENITTDRLKQALDDMAQNGEEVAEELWQRFGNSNIYHRLSVDAGLENLSMTGWTDKELGAITTHTKVYIERISSSLSAVAELMVRNKGSVTLGQLTQIDVKPGIGKSIPRLSPFFVERHDVLGFMERSLIQEPCDGQRLFVIYGMGGSGKTQTASCFGRRHRNRFRHIFFIDASSAESIKMDLQSAIRSLGPAHSQDTFEDALRFLADPDNRDWLIILDNADDPELPLTMYLPECDHGTIIVTSRNSALAKLASTSHLQLQGMNESDSFQVLFKSAQRERTRDEKESRAAIELGKLLGGLPLALVHVGCYCDTTKITFSEYSERFKSHRSKLMAMQPPLQLDKYSYSTYTSIGLSYSLLDEYSRDFLHLIAFLHPSNIHLDILRIASKSGFDLDWVWNLSPRDDQFSGHMDALRQLLTPNGFWSDVYVDSLLNQLQSFSLISLSKWNGQTNITIHPLVQSCILDTLSPEAYSRHFHMAVLMLSCCCRPGAASLAQQLSTHISELEIRQVDIHLKDAACFAYIFMMSGNFEESMKKWARVRDRCEEVNGKKHRLTLQMSYLVAECLCRMREYEAAESMIRGIAKSQEMIFGELDGDTIDSHRLLANILSDQHKTEEAEKTLKHLLALSEARYGRENRRTLEIQSSLVGNLAAQGEHAEVVTFSRKVLPIMKAVLDEEDEDLTLYTMGIMSRALTQLGGWAEAEAIRSDMIARETIKYGRHHPNTLNSLFSFTFCLAQRAEWDEAEMIIQEVLEARRRLFGMNHHDVIDALAQCNYIAEQRLLHVANNEVSDTFDPPHPVNPVSSYNPEPLYMANNEGPNTFSPPHPGSSSSSHNPKQQWKSKNIWKLLRLK